MQVEDKDTPSWGVDAALLSLEPLYADIPEMWPPQNAENTNTQLQPCPGEAPSSLADMMMTEEKMSISEGVHALQSERGWKEWVWENKQWGLLDEGFSWDVTVHSETGL